jgi:phage terminase large subunit
MDRYEEGFRFILNQGGSRSSKTFSIIQLLIVLCLYNPKISVSIVRKSFPSLRGSVMRDFMELMELYGEYNVKNHNKTEHIYEFENGSTIDFFSIDDSMKVRGRKRDICYVNEANELSHEEFMQLSLRTNKTFFLDYNPSDSEHWLYKLLEDERSCLVKSTYKDNIFLGKSLVTEIENLINVDENYYKIYALGEAPITSTRIYTHFQQYIDEPNYTECVYGIDFGYTHVSSVVKIMYSMNKIYVKELLYESGLTVNDLCNKIKDIIKDRNVIYADSARPDVIEQLKRMGLNIISSDKSVKEGIDYIKSQPIYIHYDSINLLREFRLYSWKSKGELVIDEPIKLNDDALDAMRYAIFTNKKNKVDVRKLNFF